MTTLWLDCPDVPPTKTAESTNMGHAKPPHLWMGVSPSHFATEQNRYWTSKCGCEQGAFFHQREEKTVAPKQLYRALSTSQGRLLSNSDRLLRYLFLLGTPKSRSVGSLRRRDGKYFAQLLFLAAHRVIPLRGDSADRLLRRFLFLEASDHVSYRKTKPGKILATWSSAHVTLFLMCSDYFFPKP